MSVLVAGAGVGRWATPAQADDLPASLHSMFACATAPLQTDLCQRVAVPSYFYPGGDELRFWTQLVEGVPTVGLAIINPASGPGASLNDDYHKQVATLRDQARGLIVLGYVDTDYGDENLSPLPDVKAAIDNYYDWYGVDGIFFDQASTDATDDDGDKSDLPYYQELHDFVKDKSSESLVVINPGQRTDRAYMITADIVVNFEGTYRPHPAFPNSTPYPSWQLPADAWERDYPADRFWHLVWATAEADMPNAISLSKQRHAGWIYVTPDDVLVDKDQWNSLPPEPYWSGLRQRVAERP